MVLKNRLEKDRTLQPLLARFVPLVLNTDTKDWETWSQRFKADGESIPMVFVVRSDGEQLFGQSGAFVGQALPDLLKEHLEKSGKAFTDDELQKLQQALDKATQAYQDGDIAQALTLILRYAQSGSFAEVASKVDELIAQLDSEARASIAQADKQMEDPDKAFEAALVLAGINRHFRKLPGVMKALREVTGRHLKDPGRKLLFAQAGMIERAKAYEAQRKVVRARGVYEEVLKKHPGTPAAELAKTLLDQLPLTDESPDGTDAFGVAQSSTAAAAKPAARKTRPKKRGALTSNDRKKLSAWLKTAKAFQKESPDKARDYANRIIDFDPDSPQADEARQILDQLE